MDSLQTVKVLIVDDESDYRQTAIKRLNKRGITIQGADSGGQALTCLDQQVYDIVILDVRMPGMDGIETLKAIKHRFPLVEVIMLTGHANMEVAIQGMEIGAFDYLMKPIDIDELVYKIQDAHQKRQNHLKKISGTINQGGVMS